MPADRRDDEKAECWPWHLAPQSLLSTRRYRSRDRPTERTCAAGHRASLAALAVVGFPFGQLQRDRESVRIDDRVDLGRKPAAGAAHAMITGAFFSPLSTCW